ncbi:MAG TPA: hypothetical protein VGA36_04160 [Nitriliruptorales bacterium]
MAAPGSDLPPQGDEPDPSVIWRWMARATAPWIAWLLVVAGIVAILLGWAGSSDKTFPAQQIPYLISGGMLGIGLIFLGGIMMGVQDVRRAITRITNLERKVTDLHAILLAHPAAPAPTGNGRPATTAESVAMLPSGTTFHRADCSIVEGKDDVTIGTVADAEAKGLKPCKLCSPVIESSPTQQITIS